MHDEPIVQAPVVVDPTSATVTIDIEANPDQVWRALTTNDGLAAWLGAGSTMGEQAGDELYVADVATGDPKRGRIDYVRTGQRLVYTWWSDREPSESSQVDITLLPCETGTRVTVVETQPRLAAASCSQGAATRATASWAWRTALLALAAQTVSLSLSYR